MVNTIIATQTELNTLHGIFEYLSSTVNLTISDALTELANTKLNNTGGFVYGSLEFSDGATITGVPTPRIGQDVVNKEYVDSLIEGRKWVQAVKVSSTEELTLFGPQVINGVTVNLKDRVLAQHQSVSAENGIYLVSAEEWHRAPDFDEPDKINQAAVYDIHSDKSYKQINEVFNVGSDALIFSEFQTPQIKNVGPGLSLSDSGGVSLLLDKGLKLLENKLTIDIGSNSGLELAPFLRIKDVVTADTYTKVQVNTKGQVVSGSNPTRLEDYHITDAVNKAGDVMSGPLKVGENKISNTVVESTAFISTHPYGIGQGDNKTHLGYLENGLYVNYLRGDRTRVDSELDVRGASKYFNTIRIGGAGYLLARPGDNNRPGQLEFAAADGEQRGFIGGGVPGRLMLNTAPNWKYTFSETPLVLNAPILHSQNYQEFAPSLTGSGATGTWGINISGNAGTASSIPWAGISGKPNAFTNLAWGSNTVKVQMSGDNVDSALPWKAGSPTLMGFDGTNTVGVRVDRSRVSDSTDQKTIGNIKTDGVAQGTLGSISITGQSGGFSGIDFFDAQATFALNSTKSGIFRGTNWEWSFVNGVLSDGLVPGNKVQGEVNTSLFANTSGGLKFADTTLPFTGVGTETLTVLGINNGEIKQVPALSLKVANAVTADVAGNTASITGATDKDYNWSGKNQFRSSVTGYVGVSKFNLESRNTAAGAAGISFVRNDNFGINIGLDPDNVFRIGGYSGAAGLFQLNMAGDLTVPGNVHQSSDIRLKRNIDPITSALSKVSKLTGVNFTRKDTGDRNTGLIAQDVLSVLPEAVHTDSEGMLSVSYGNLVGLLVEAIKELQSEVKSLQSLVVARS